MAQTHLKGNAVDTVGDLPAVGSAAPAFTVTGTDLSDVSLADHAGKRVILNIFPSIDTGICAASTRRFNEEAGKLDNTVVLCVSADLPFAHGRFCEAEGLNDVIPTSVFKSSGFGQDYGVTMSSGPLTGLLARAVVVIGADGKVAYTELVPEIAQEPDYEAALAAL